MKLVKLIGTLKLFFVAFKEFNRERIFMNGAALSYYTVFALVPMIVMIIGIVGLFFEEAIIREQIEEVLNDMMGPKTTEQIFNATIASESSQGSLISTIVGTSFLIFSSTAVLYSLKYYINMIWRIPQPADRVVVKNIFDRLISFCLLLFFGFLIILSFFLEGGMSALNHEISGLFPTISTQTILLFNAGFSLLFNTLLFFLIFEILPDARVNWKIGLLGSFVTALLFNVSQFIIGFYLSHSPYIQAWGAAGSLLVVLFWVFISSQVILYGAKLTYLFGEYYQHPILPSRVLKFWQRKKKEAAPD